MRLLVTCIVVLVLSGCDTDIGTPVKYTCQECVNEKTCPNNTCNDSAYDSCLRAKVIAGICQED